MRHLLLITVVTFCAGFTLAQGHYSSDFQKTYADYPNVTPGVLEAVSWMNTRMTKLEKVAPSCSGLPSAYGILGLHDDGKDYFIENGKFLAKLSGISISEQKSSVSNELAAYAYVYDELMAQEILSGGSKFDGNSIRNVLLQLSEIPDSGVVNVLARDMQVYEVLRFLTNQKYAQARNFTVYAIDLESVFGVSNYAVLSSRKIQFTSTGILSDKGVAYSLSAAKSIEYGPAIWNPAPTCNFSSRSGTAISAITIHTVQGTYAGAISWAQNCMSGVSYHYVIRSSDGQVTQMVLEADKAWHVGSENPYTIGYEHEGYVDNPIWYTEAMYNSSADLSRDIVSSGYGIPPHRTYYGPSSATTDILGGCTKIKGHQHFVNQTHTDPGINWDWEKYYRLINQNPSYTLITSLNGSFYDTGGATGDYQDDERELWLFQPPGMQSVTLDFTSFDLEIDYDYLFIYDGADIDASLIGMYTGLNSPGIVTSSTGSIVVEFRSDCGTTNPGWEVSYSSTPIDNNPPTTTIVSNPVWQTNDFPITINDNDTGSGIESGFYLIAERNPTDLGWKSNGSYGFIHEDFEDGNSSWTNQVGPYLASGGSFVYSNTAEQNSNAYASVSQDASTSYLYEWNQTITSNGSNQRAGMHFFCDDATLPNRGNSYFIFARENSNLLHIYRVTNDIFSLESEVPLTINQNVSYNFKTLYNPQTGLIKVYVDDLLISQWTDPTPLTNGGAISLRTGGCSAEFDNVHVYRSRGNTVTIPAGFGEAMSIESENAIETGLVKSIALDNSDNWSVPASELYLLDFSPPTLNFLSDGLGNDIDTFYTTAVEANWNIEDIHSDIADFEYAIGTAPGLDDVFPWASNGTGLSFTELVSSLIPDELYYVSVKATNQANLEETFSSNGQRYMPNAGILEDVFAILNVYPNPVSETLFIEGLIETSHVDIIDASGRVCFSRTFDNSLSIDISAFASGNYRVVLRAENALMVKSIVIR